MNVTEVDFSEFGVTLPADRLGFVVAQPFQRLSAEPFRWEADTADQQRKFIASTLQLGVDRPHGCDRTHFVLFPEYSLPGLSGVELVQAALEAAEYPPASIVMAGCDALSKAEYEQLAMQANTYAACPPEVVQADEWVNCAIIWLKAADSTVHKWVQPKLSPAWAELDLHHGRMFRGTSVFLFRGLRSDDTEYRFAAVICFDWVSSQGGRKPWEVLFTHLGEKVKPGTARFNWFFVLQSNPKPSHPSFLNEVTRCLDLTQHKNVVRDTAIVFFVNSAGRERPGAVVQYGSSSLVFPSAVRYARQQCLATFSSGGERFRGSAILNGLREVFFRESGECIHTFRLLDPGEVQGGAIGRAFPLEQAFVFRAPGSVADSRAPGGPVYASVKWTCDLLDELEGLGSRHECHLKPNAIAVDAVVRDALRVARAPDVERTVSLAHVGPPCTADDWDRPQQAGVEHLVHSLTITGVAHTLAAVGAGDGHAILETPDESVEIVAVTGKTHEDCREHARKNLPPTRRRRLLITRDLDNTVWNPRFGSFLRQVSKADEKKITDPESAVRHCGYSELLTLYRAATSVPELQGGIDELID